MIDEGRMFATAYLLDGDARAALAQGTAAIAFEAEDDGPGGVAARGGEPAFAIDEEWLLDRVAEAGFKTVGIRHGSWTPHEDTKAFPDILVARL
jgi:hypothetical protein